jgi:hypothetical protein
MLNEGRVTDTRLYEGMACPLCGRSLLPIPAGDSVSFHCKSGHELPLRDLFKAQTHSLRRGLEMLVADWDKQFRTLSATALDARRNGYLDVADIFHRQANVVAARIAALRACLPRADEDSSRSWKVVELPGSGQG